MTPLNLSYALRVAEKAWGDATQFFWFDCRNTKHKDTIAKVNALTDSRLPFDNCAIVWPIKSIEEGQVDAVIFLKNQDDGVGVYVTMLFPDGVPVAFPPFSYEVVDDEVRMWLSKDTHEAKVNANNTMVVLNKWFTLLMQDGGEAYGLIAPKTTVNQRRIAKGKRPLYDWRTVVIGPANARTESHGGTHASPRQHDRRGHLRRLKSGKTVWVRQTKVGKASDGFVFHDYVVA